MYIRLLVIAIVMWEKESDGIDPAIVMFYTCLCAVG